MQFVEVEMETTSIKLEGLKVFNSKRERKKKANSA
jgi:hypothetical protein